MPTSESSDPQHSISDVREAFAQLRAQARVISEAGHADDVVQAFGLLDISEEPSSELPDAGELDAWLQVEDSPEAVEAMIETVFDELAISGEDDSETDEKEKETEEVPAANHQEQKITSAVSPRLSGRP